MSIRHSVFATTFALVAVSVALPALAQSGRVAQMPRQYQSADASLDGEVPRPRMRRVSPYLVNGFGIGASMVNINTKADVVASRQFGFWPTIKQAFDQESRSGTNFGFSASYAMVQRMGFGFTADLMYSDVQKIISNDRYGYLRPAANVAFGASRSFYGFGGLNMMSFTSEPKGIEGTEFAGQSIKLQSQVGWQVGGAFVMGNFEAKAQYSTSSVKVDQNLKSAFIGTPDTRVEGKYDFTGFELTAQYRF